MGEAKKRAAELLVWQNRLSIEEQVILAVCKTAYEKIVVGLGMTEACYRLSLFLTYYLLEEHDVQVEPIVGYVNEGESPIMASHAWMELNGRIIDLGLTLTSDPKVQPPGPLLILGRQMKAGRANYTYHRERSPEAILEVANLLRDPAYKETVLRQEDEHRWIAAIANDRKLIRDYLDAAPDGLAYEKLAALIR